MARPIPWCRKKPRPSCALNLQARDALPAGGSVGYEIFDKADTFSATSFVQGINQGARAGRRTRPHHQGHRACGAGGQGPISIPEKKLFDREKQDPRASIILNVRGELDVGQIRAIRHLVASAAGSRSTASRSSMNTGPPAGRWRGQ